MKSPLEKRYSTCYAANVPFNLGASLPTPSIPHCWRLGATRLLRKTYGVPCDNTTLARLVAWHPGYRVLSLCCTYSVPDTMIVHKTPTGPREQIDTRRSSSRGHGCVNALSRVTASHSHGLFFSILRRVSVVGDKVNPTKRCG